MGDKGDREAAAAEKEEEFIQKQREKNELKLKLQVIVYRIRARIYSSLRTKPPPGPDIASSFIAFRLTVPCPRLQVRTAVVETRITLTPSDLALPISLSPHTRSHTHTMLLHHRSLFSLFLPLCSLLIAPPCSYVHLSGI